MIRVESYSGPQPKALSPGQVEQFIAEGYLLVPGLIARECVEALVPLIWAALGDVAQDAGKRSPDGGYMLKDTPRGEAVRARVTPRYRQIIADLCGEGRGTFWEDGLGYMPVRFPHPERATLAWAAGGMHVDGTHFQHHVDAADQALVVLELFSDIAPRGGGTAIRVGSHADVARLLQQAEPAGLTCGELSDRAVAAAAGRPLVEITGRAGDVLFMHAFTLHGSSTNLSERVRLASNHCVPLKEKMQLMRANPAAYSPVEYAIREALHDA